uniref:VPS9 domain-containing protein n=4 Tax=Macrostomum lignano TaxID=282301 RepID=A0A1I8JL98_9PLAT
SMYHALTNSVLCYLRAILTMEQPDMALAAELVSRALRVCQRSRRRRFAGLASLRPDSFSDEECHAELCYAELLLESAVLAFVQDETMVSFIRGGLRVRECHQLYRLCFRLLRKRAWSNARLRAQFESGARMGIGAFSLLVSMLPATVLRLLQFIGFSGDRQFGLEQLEAAAAVTDSLRAPLAQLLLASYYANQAQ